MKGGHVERLSTVSDNDNDNEFISHTCGYRDSLNNSAVQTVQRNNTSTVRKCKITDSISTERNIIANDNSNSP